MTRAAMRRRGMGAAGLVLCGVLSGCAVLTVDVDVYKGALVNEEEVQLHQLVALATAAKPMLIQLRDNLEWPDTDGIPVADARDPEHASCLKEPQVKDWYQPKYVSPPKGYFPEVESRTIVQAIGEWFRKLFKGPPPSCQPHFKSPYARNVNHALSLYEDLDSPDFEPYGRKLREALERLRRATLVLEPNKQRDRAAFAAIAAGLKKEEDLSANPGLQSLRRAYKDLLVPGERDKGKSKRDVGELMDAFHTLVRQGEKGKPQSKDGIAAALVEEWNGTKTYEEAIPLYDRRLPFRAVWKLLGEGEQNTWLAEATRPLCVEGLRGDEACPQLVERTKELADAYWESRQAAHDLWEESLGLLVRIERVERAQPKRYHALKEMVIRLAVAVTSVRQIASALSRLGDDGACAVLENALVREWQRTCEGEPKGTAWTEENVTKNRKHFETILKQTLSSAPADTALLLLNLDSLEQHAIPKNSDAAPLVKKANRVNPKRVVRLGLNRNFIEASGSDKESEPAEVFQVVEDVNRDLAHGFGRGRLADGLHTLTERYLQSHNGVTTGADLDDQKRLLDSLVEFAQKLLFLANHDSLASPPGTEGLIVGGGKNILRGLLGDDAIAGYEKTSVIGQSHAPQAMTKRYVRVLQAVGNSILFSANELRERDRYRELSQKRVPAEIAAVNAVYSPDPRKVLNDLVKELQHEQMLAQQQLDEATAKKAAIDGQIGSAAAPKTGLRSLEDKADDEVNKATQARDGYLTQLSSLKAIHDVVTPPVVGQIKKGWTAAGTGDAADLANFLTGPAGLEQQLDAIRLAQDGTPTPEERFLFDQAIAYAKAPESKTAFEAYRTSQGHTSLKRADLLTVFTAHLRELEAARAARVAQYEKIREEKEQARRDVLEKLAQLSAESARLAAVIAGLPGTKARLATAATVIEAVKDEVLKAAPPVAPFLSPDAIYALLIFHVQQKEAVETDVGKKQSYQDTQAVLTKRTPPPSLPPLKDGDYNSPVDVMDRVIALLRHRAMEAVERHGQDSPASKRATEALENAYQHRAGMIYLRPSSAYLRTSFPSTSLQDDPNLAWDNMLLSQGIRNLPFSSQLADIFNPSERQDRTLTAELDKQYWQNINRVRVSGAGFTNQALVKDDVGNWYVKQYFGDTKDIVKSAKHLALFSLGTTLPIDLSHELGKASRTQDESQKSAADKEADAPPLQKVFGKHRTAYQAHTVQTSTRLAELHGTEDGKKTVYGKIIDAWKGAGWEGADESKKKSLMETLTAALKEEVTQWDKTVEPLKKASDQERGLAITKDLNALARLEKGLSARIRRDVTLSEPEKAKAMGVVHAVVGPVLLDLLEDRKQALDRYEQAILFIGDAANPKDPKQEQGK